MRDSKSDIGEFWDSRAAWYSDRFDERNGDAHALRARLQATLRLVGRGPGTILDAGMGPGWLCASLDSMGWTVHGVDASAEMVAIARRRLPNAADRLVQATIEGLPFPHAVFDAVTATGVLEYTSVRSALDELARVVKPAGTVIVSYPNPRAFYRMWKAWLYYPLVRLLRQMGPESPERPPTAGQAIGPDAFVVFLREAGLEPVSYLHTSAQPIAAPFDTILPRFTAAVARRVEAKRRLMPLLGTQIVYEARKPG